MLKSLGWVIALATVGVGCASPAQIDQKGIELQQQAQMYRTIGEYDRAARTQEKADKQFAKAAYRRQQYRYGM